MRVSKKKEKVSIASQDIDAIETEVSGLRSRISSLEIERLAACDLLGNLRNYLESTSHEAAHRTETMVALTDAILKLLGDEE